MKWGFLNVEGNGGGEGIGRGKWDEMDMGGAMEAKISMDSGKVRRRGRLD